MFNSVSYKQYKDEQRIMWIVLGIYLHPKLQVST